MKFSRSSVSALALSLLSFAGSHLATPEAAQAAPSRNREKPAMIEVGGGAAHLGDSTSIEALIRVRAEIGSDTSFISGDRFILVRVNADGTVGLDGVRFIDIDFETLGYEWKGHNEFTMAGLSVINGSLDRNLPINNAMTVSLNFLGIKGGFGGHLTPEIEGYLRGAINLLGIAYSERLADGQANTGSSSGLQIEAGLQILKKFRIAIGHEVKSVNNDPFTYETGGYSCDTYYSDNDYYSSSYTSCSPDTNTVYLERRVLNDTSLTLVAELTRNLQLFGEVHYNIYSVISDTGEFNSTRDSALQLFLGVAGRF